MQGSPSISLQYSGTCRLQRTAPTVHSFAGQSAPPQQAGAAPASELAIQAAAANRRSRKLERAAFDCERRFIREPGVNYLSRMCRTPLLNSSARSPMRESVEVLLRQAQGGAPSMRT